MSPAAAGTARKDAHLELIVAMGGDREKGYDPFPPDQYSVFQDENMALTLRAHRALAWVRFGTLRLKLNGKRTPFVTDETGTRALRLKDMADALFNGDMAAASTVWRELERKRLVQKKDGKLWLNATVPRPTEAPEDEEARAAVADPRFAKLKRYIREQLERLPAETRERATHALFMLEEKGRDLEKDAMYGARSLREQLEEIVMAMYGVILRRHEDRQRDEPIVQISVPDLFVQNFLKELEENYVQTTKTDPYKQENSAVQDSYPYRTENRDNRVSSEDAGTESGFSCEDSPTQEDEAEAVETENHAPEAAETPEVENLPVDENSKPAAEENSTVVAYIESYFEQPLTPALREQWAELPNKFGISPTSVVRFLMQKTAEKETKDYDLQGPSALLQFARIDIPRFIKKNRAFIARDLEREEARTRAAAPAEPEPPEQPAETTMRSFEINRQFLEMFPTHKDAPKARENLAADRERLEQELGRLLARVDADPEHPTSDRERGMIATLKRLLTTKADGAAAG